MVLLLVVISTPELTFVRDSVTMPQYSGDSHSGFGNDISESCSKEFMDETGQSHKPFGKTSAAGNSFGSSNLLIPTECNV